jgi:hypothetical protein
MRPIQMKVLFVGALLAAAAGCASYPPAGPKEGDKPPRVVLKDGKPTWDNPGAFGPVPESLAEAGRKACAVYDTDKVKHVARGYHSRAENVSGRTLPKGGYYCVPS